MHFSPLKLTVNLHRGVTGPSVPKPVVPTLTESARGLVRTPLLGTVERTVRGGLWNDVIASGHPVLLNWMLII